MSKVLKKENRSGNDKFGVTSFSTARKGTAFNYLSWLAHRKTNSPGNKTAVHHNRDFSSKRVHVKHLGEEEHNSRLTTNKLRTDFFRPCV